MYDIGTLQKRDKETKEFFKQHFVDFFKEFDYKNLSSQIVNVAVNSHDDLNQVRYGTGLYFILSNYQFDSNPCTLKLNGLKVIYRGHGVRIRKRVESHIYNDNYNQDKDGTTYSVCMKLDRKSVV